MQMATSIETDNGEMIVKRVSVPVGLEELMEGLTKEVILKKPKDIYVFASEYFANLLNLRDKGSLKVAARRVQSITKQISADNIGKHLKSTTKLIETKKQLSEQGTKKSGTTTKKSLTTKKIVLGPKEEKDGKKTERTKTLLDKHKARKNSKDNLSGNKDQKKDATKLEEKEKKTPRVRDRSSSINSNEGSLKSRRSSHSSTSQDRMSSNKSSPRKLMSRKNSETNRKSLKTEGKTIGTQQISEETKKSDEFEDSANSQKIDENVENMSEDKPQIINENSESNNVCVGCTVKSDGIVDSIVAKESNLTSPAIPPDVELINTKIEKLENKNENISVDEVDTTEDKKENEQEAENKVKTTETIIDNSQDATSKEHGGDEASDLSKSYADETDQISEIGEQSEKTIDEITNTLKTNESESEEVEKREEDNLTKSDKSTCKTQSDDEHKAEDPADAKEVSKKENEKENHEKVQLGVDDHQNEINDKINDGVSDEQRKSSESEPTIETIEKSKCVEDTQTSSESTNMDSNWEKPVVSSDEKDEAVEQNEENIDNNHQSKNGTNIGSNNLELSSSSVDVDENSLLKNKTNENINNEVEKKKNDENGKIQIRTKSLDNLMVNEKLDNENRNAKRVKSVDSNFDASKLHDEILKTHELSKSSNFKSSYNPYILKQEIKQASDHSKKENKIESVAGQIYAALKIQSLWRGFQIRKQFTKKSLRNANLQNQENVLSSEVTQKFADNSSEIVTAKKTDESDQKANIVNGKVEDEGNKGTADANVNNETNRSELEISDVKTPAIEDRNNTQTDGDGEFKEHATSKSNKENATDDSKQVDDNITVNEKVRDINKSESQIDDNQNVETEVNNSSVQPSESDSKEDQIADNENSIDENAVFQETNERSIRKLDSSQLNAGVDEFSNKKETVISQQEEENTNQQLITNEKKSEFDDSSSIKNEYKEQDTISGTEKVDSDVLTSNREENNELAPEATVEKTTHSSGQLTSNNGDANKIIGSSKQENTTSGEEKLEDSENITIPTEDVATEKSEESKSQSNDVILENTVDSNKSTDSEQLLLEKTDVKDDEVSQKNTSSHEQENSKQNELKTLNESISDTNENEVPNGDGDQEKTHSEIPTKDNNTKTSNEDSEKEILIHTDNSNERDEKSESVLDSRTHSNEPMQNRDIHQNSNYMGEDVLEPSVSKTVASSTFAEHSSNNKDNTEPDKTDHVIETKIADKDVKEPLDSIKLHMVDAVLKIQAVWRGFKVRKHLEHEKLFGSSVKKEVKNVEALEVAKKNNKNKAVLKIQAAWRGYKVRKNIKDVDSRLEGLQKPQECDEMPHQRGLTDEEIFKAATKIQAGVRGYMVRKKRNTVSKLNSITEETSSEDNSPEPCIEATKKEVDANVLESAPKSLFTENKSDNQMDTNTTKVNPEKINTAESNKNLIHETTGNEASKNNASPNTKEDSKKAENEVDVMTPELNPSITNKLSTSDTGVIIDDTISNDFINKDEFDPISYKNLDDSSYECAPTRPVTSSTNKEGVDDEKNTEEKVNQNNEKEVVNDLKDIKKFTKTAENENETSDKKKSFSNQESVNSADSVTTVIFNDAENDNSSTLHHSVDQGNHDSNHNEPSDQRIIDAENISNVVNKANDLSELKLETNPNEACPQKDDKIDNNIDIQSENANEKEGKADLNEAFSKKNEKIEDTIDIRDKNELTNGKEETTLETTSQNNVENKESKSALPVHDDKDLEKVVILKGDQNKQTEKELQTNPIDASETLVGSSAESLKDEHAQNGSLQIGEVNKNQAQSEEIEKAVDTNVHNSVTDVKTIDETVHSTVNFSTLNNDTQSSNKQLQELATTRPEDERDNLETVKQSDAKIIADDETVHNKINVPVLEKEIQNSNEQLQELARAHSEDKKEHLETVDKMDVNKNEIIQPDTKCETLGSDNLYNKIDMSALEREIVNKKEGQGLESISDKDGESNIDEIPNESKDKRSIPTIDDTGSKISNNEKEELAKNLTEKEMMHLHIPLRQLSEIKEEDTCSSESSKLDTTTQAAASDSTDTSHEEATSPKGEIKLNLQNEEATINLIHSGEFHDTITVPLPVTPPTRTSSRQSQNQTEERQASPSGLVHSGELHDNVLPLSVQLNDASPAGAEVLTSHRSESVDGNGQDRAQASNKDASTCESTQSDNRTSSEVSMETEKRNNATVPKKNMEAEAATKIQAGFRGYQVRKQLKNKIRAPGDISNQRRSARRKSSGRLTESGRIVQNKKTPTDIEEKSAVKIQAGVRGFLVRRRQKKQKQGKQ